MDKNLKKIGVKDVDKHQTKELKRESQGEILVQPVAINQVGNYCEGEEGNTTLPVESNKVKSLAILDNGVGFAIATKIM